MPRQTASNGNACRGDLPLAAAVPPGDAARRLRRAGYLLGFGMGGLFDGILLHQILQWHHLLSALQTGLLGSLRAQVVADGIFHALMYGVAVAGLVTLYRVRKDEATPRRTALAAFLIGFGLWHVTDALLSHWILGIHRIRMDSSVPLAWDLAWLALFGLAPLAVGMRMRRHGGGPPADPRCGRASIGLLAACVIASGLAGLLPPRGGAAATVVVLRPGASAIDLLAALDDTPARVVWMDPQGAVWIVAGMSARSAMPLYGQGALYISGTMAPAGCAAWLGPPPKR